MRSSSWSHLARQLVQRVVGELTSFDRVALGASLMIGAGVGAPAVVGADGVA